MALQVWLPLNGDLENKGLKNISIVNSGATVSASGKIGSCYSFTNNKIICGNPNIPGSNISASAWIYLTNISSLQYIISLNNSGGWADQSIGISVEEDDIYFCAGSSYCSSSNIQTNKWFHVVVTYDGSKIRGYIDGIEVASINASSPINRNFLTIGARYNGSSYVYLLNNAKLNDIRIYDHCLSKKEIKEISKGLVLHYKLDIPNKNLISSKWHNPSSYLAYQYNLSENLVSGQTYTFQLWDVDVSHTGKNTNNLGVGIFWGGGNVKLKTILGNPYFQSGHTDYLTFTLTISASQATGSGSSNKWINIYNSPVDASGTRYMHIGAIKIEKGPLATPFTNFNEDISSIPDCSGYGNNGTPYDTFSQRSVSPRYLTAIEFNGTTNAIGIGNLLSYISDGTFTFNVWFNVVSFGSDRWGTIFGGPSGFEFQSKRSSGTTPTLVAFSWGQRDSGGQPYTLNTWNMVTMVRTTSNCKFYLNGELYYTGSAGSIPSGNYFLGSWRDSSSQNYKGFMSDARIYATALSDSDIKELYETVATIDKNGNLSCYEFDERGTAPQIRKNGVVETGLIVEGQANKFKALSDGSIWVQLLHHNNPASNLFTASNCWNYDNGTNLYSALFLLKNGDFKNSQGQYEFLACEKLTSASTETLFRWKQTSNPSVSSTITGFSAISGSSFYNYRGLLTNGNYGCMHNGSTWWGCCGSYTPYQGGIPGFSNIITSGYLDLYVRVTENTVKGATTSGVTALYKEAIASNSFFEN